ncbi:MAG: riboflavin biosynthesis protein RibF [Liquorilactobacillus satsumensis]|uniref:riboflavin biosynthesis protein RibF n=1 Tax=Liquorilactobacillus satsumensis TaxID=259059 RepID=UPI0039E829EA
MQIIKLEEPFDKAQIPAGSVVLALGFFDGVHRGHQAVIETARQEARKRGVKLAIMTLTPHPSIIFQHVPPEKVTYLTSLERKLQLFAHFGAEIAYVVALNSQVSKMGPQEFVDKYMVGLHAQAIVAGEDYTYGTEKIANMELLPQYAQARFAVIKVRHLKQMGQKISSTRIRTCLDHGQITQANHLLGYCYENDGVIVHGKQVGRTLGFPTINISVGQGERLPAEGIYAVKVRLLGKTVDGMASIGRNETFGSNNAPTLEINLLDFSQMVYGEHVVVQWHQYLRGQVKFPNAQALIVQLKRDEKNVRAYFAAK